MFCEPFINPFVAVFSEFWSKKNLLGAVVFILNATIPSVGFVTESVAEEALKSTLEHMLIL